MKKLTLIFYLVLTICFSDLKAQFRIDTILFSRPFLPITLQLLMDYETVCLSDTIVATVWEGDYIIDRGTYKEIVSIEQLNEWGYEYKYRWIISMFPFKAKYYFIREPTLKDFIKWVQKKLNTNNHE